MPVMASISKQFLRTWFGHNFINKQKSFMIFITENAIVDTKKEREFFFVDIL